MESHSTYQSLSDFLVEEFLGKERLLFIQLSFCTKTSGEKDLFLTQHLCAHHRCLYPGGYSSMLWWSLFQRLQREVFHFSETFPLNRLHCYVTLCHHSAFSDNRKSFLFLLDFYFTSQVEGELPYMHCPIFRTCPKTLMLTASYFDVAFRSHIYVLLATHHVTAVVNVL